MVLIINDGAPKMLELVGALSARRYRLRFVAPGDRALDAALAHGPDVILLDLDGSEIDEVALCRHLRRRVHRPIIVLSGLGSAERKVAMLDAGADDYITKPLWVAETVARVRVALRNRGRSEAVDLDKIEVGRLLIDLDAHQALIGGVPIDLTRKELVLLIVLARNADRTVPCQVLLDEVWGPGHTLQNLRYHVAQVRRKFAPYETAPYLGMKRGIGYYLSSEEPNQ
jgi:two-component system KDP operon response regulator KdpE